MKNTVLLIGAHTDDIELMMGGTASRLCQRGDDVYYITFSFSENSLMDGFDDDVTKKESIEAAKVLGIIENNIIQYSYPTRYFFNHRQEILENLVDIRKRIKPNIVFTHSIKDIHQDHSIIAYESLRAFKLTSSIFCGILSYNNISDFNYQAFFSLNEIELTNKIDAVGKYESQIIKTDVDYKEKIKSDAMYYGGMIKKKYAEAFESPRIIIV